MVTAKGAAHTSAKHGLPCPAFHGCDPPAGNPLPILSSLRLFLISVRTEIITYSTREWGETVSFEQWFPRTGQRNNNGWVAGAQERSLDRGGVSAAGVAAAWRWHVPTRSNDCVLLRGQE
jgi:hypothetical protein